jgi:hypothetical protein
MRAKLGMVAGAVGVAAIGFWAGQRFGPASEDAVVVMPTVLEQASAPSMQTSRVDATPAAATQASMKPVVISSLREILQLKSDFAQSTALFLLASRKDRDGIEALLVEAAKLTSDSDRNAATSILYSRLAELDPNAAVERILRSDDLEQRYLQDVFHQWSRGNLQQALACAAGLKDERSRGIAVRAILMARADLPQAQREAIASKYNVGLPAGNLGRPDLSTPAAAEHSWREALALTDARERSTRLSQLAYFWGRQSPEAALQAIEQLDDFEMRNQLMYQSLRAWSEKSPQAAFEWAQSRRPSPERIQLVSLTLQSLAKEQPQMAVELAEKLPQNMQRSLLPQLLQQWAQTDLSAVMARLDAIKDPSLRASTLYSIASSYGTRSPDEALRWAASLPLADAQSVMSSIVMRVASKDPIRATSLINSFPEGSSRDMAISSLAANWSQRDPSAALSWVLRMPSAQTRNNAVTSVFSTWASYDPAAAAQQVTQLTDPALRDSAATSMIMSQYLEPDIVEQLYARIENPRQRTNAAAQLYYRFRESDPARAERYRRDSGMPEMPMQRR